MYEPIEEFLGKVFSKIEVEDTEIKFHCDDGSIYLMHHE